MNNVHEEEMVWEQLQDLKQSLALERTSPPAVTFVSAVGRALLEGSLPVEQRAALWEKVKARVGLEASGSAAPARPIEKLKWSLPLQRRGVGFGFIGVGVAAVAIVAMVLWPKPTAITPAAIAARMEETWESINGYHRVMVSPDTSGQRITTEEWLRRPDRLRSIGRRADGSVYRDELILGRLTTTYYPERSVIVKERTRTGVLGNLARGVPRDEGCMLSNLRSPQATILHDERLRGRECWVVGHGQSRSWIAKENYMLMKVRTTLPDGRKATEMETVSFEASHDLRDDLFMQKVPAGVTVVEGSLPFDKDWFPINKTKPRDEMRRDLLSCAASAGGMTCLPGYLPRGFSYLKCQNVAQRLHIWFLNVDTGGRMMIVQNPWPNESPDKPDEEHTISIREKPGILKTFREPFRILQLEFQQRCVPMLISASQIPEHELVKVAEELQLKGTMLQPTPPRSFTAQSCTPAPQQPSPPSSAPLVWDNHTESFSVRPVRPGLVERSLRSAAEILKARLETAGAKSADYQISAEDSVRFTVAGLPHQMIAPLVTPQGRFSIKVLARQYRPQAERDAFGREMLVCTDAEGRQVPWAASLAGVKPFITNKDLAEVTPADSPDLNQWLLQGRLNASGTERFAQFTARSVGRYTPMQVDDQVISCPNIRSSISGGRFMILTSSDESAARALAAVLSNGALPCSFTIVPDELRHSHSSAVSSNGEEGSKSSPPTYSDAAVLTAQCQSTLKQLIMACIMYAQPHANKLPPAPRWCDSIEPFTRNAELFHCPAKSLPEGGYAFYKNLSNRPLGTIPYPKEMVVPFETGKSGKNLSGGPELLPAKGAHKDGINVAYADGHVKWLNVELAKMADWKGVSAGR